MCDYDPPEFFWCRTPKARKEHKCGECGIKILKGEIYQVFTGKWDGNMDTYKSCLPCAQLYDYAQKNEIPVEGTYSHTGCLYYGELQEVVRQSPELCPNEMLSPIMKELKANSIMRLKLG